MGLDPKRTGCVGDHATSVEKRAPTADQPKVRDLTRPLGQLKSDLQADVRAVLVPHHSHGRVPPGQPVSPKEMAMNDTQASELTDSTLKWGGLAGVAGSLALLGTFGLVAAFVGMDITPAESLTTFPDIKVARTFENSLYLGALLLWALHYLAMHRAFSRNGETAPLFGTALSLGGLVLLAAGAVPHVATAPLSDLYQTPGATTQDQATLVMLWTGIEAVFEALLYTGLVILPLGLVALGTAMRRHPGYGPRLAMSTIGLGIAGLAAAVAVLLGLPDMAAIGVLALMAFHLTLGWRTVKVAKSPRARVSVRS